MARGYTDAFGVEISEGDVILSAATSGYTMAIGYARIRPNTLGVEEAVSSGHSYYKTRQVGSWVVVLCKALLEYVEVHGDLPVIINDIELGELGIETVSKTDQPEPAFILS